MTVTTFSHMERTPQIDPCPFCGSEAVCVHEDANKQFYVFCADCGTLGSLKVSIEQAIASWNERKGAVSSGDFMAMRDRVQELERLIDRLRLDMLPAQTGITDLRVELTHVENMALEARGKIMNHDIKLSNLEARLSGVQYGGPPRGSGKTPDELYTGALALRDRMTSLEAATAPAIEATKKLSASLSGLKVGIPDGSGLVASNLKTPTS